VNNYAKVLCATHALIAFRITVLLLLYALHSNLTPLQWMLLQLNGILGDKSKYLKFWTCVSTTEQSAEHSMVNDLLDFVTKRFGQTSKTIPIILDEAQELVIATKKYKKSEEKNVRPALSPIVDAITSLRMCHLLLGGTSLRIEHLGIVGSVLAGKSLGPETRDKLVKVTNFSITETKNDVESW